MRNILLMVLILTCGLVFSATASATDCGVRGLRLRSNFRNFDRFSVRDEFSLRRQLRLEAALRREALRDDFRFRNRRGLSLRFGV
jgi:hypothetical protein